MKISRKSIRISEENQIKLDYLKINLNAKSDQMLFDKIIDHAYELNILKTSNYFENNFETLITNLNSTGTNEIINKMQEIKFCILLLQKLMESKLLSDVHNINLDYDDKESCIDFAIIELEQKKFLNLLNGIVDE